jgi:TonB family protein
MPDTSRALRKSLIAAALLVLLSQAVPAFPQEKARAEGPPYRVGGGVTRPEIISSVKPIYTELARRSRVTGVVIVEAVIDEKGNVTDVRVLKGLPMGLSEAAVDAIQNWKFKPATLEGRPVQVYYVLTVNFQVDDTPFGYGPLFAKFLALNPEFQADLRDKRYREAAELLDLQARERPGDSAIPLARVHLLLEQGLLQEARQEALKAQGPERYESLCAVGVSAGKQASDKSLNLDDESRNEAVELGLQAETAAMAIQPKAFDAVLFKSWLLRVKAELILDPAERQALNEEAEQLRKQALELQKAQGAGAAPPQDRP